MRILITFIDNGSRSVLKSARADFSLSPYSSSKMHRVSRCQFTSNLPRAPLFSSGLGSVCLSAKLDDKILSSAEICSKSEEGGGYFTALLSVHQSVPLFASLPSFEQGSAKSHVSGCVNAAGKVRQKWQATAATKFTKPGNKTLVQPCSLLLLWRTFLCPISGGGVGKTPLPLIFCLSSLLKKASHAIQPIFKALCF